MNKRRGRIGQTFIYLEKFGRIFIYEKGWKSIVFAAIISTLIAFVVGKNMFTNKENLVGYTFTLISACIWIGIFNSIQNICRERDIIKREHRSGLHISAYMAAHMLFQAALCLAETLVLVLICNIIIDFPKVGLVTGSYLLDLGITFFLCIYAADVLALLVSSIVKDSKTAMTVMPFLLIFQLIFSGAMLDLTGPAEAVTNATVSRWGIVAVCAESDYNELTASVEVYIKRMIRSSDKYKEFTEYLGEDQAQEIENELILDFQDYLRDYTHDEKYEHEASLVQRCWLWLVLFTLLYGALGVIVLKFVDLDKR